MEIMKSVSSSYYVLTRFLGDDSKNYQNFGVKMEIIYEMLSLYEA